MTDTRSMRSDNARLMETNLSLLLECREMDTEINEMREKLLAKCKLLEKRGIPVPQQFLELLASQQGSQIPPTNP
ncbi:hypothetical protein P3T76_002763 [Phytophthora citrophthora]|uniref:Uncharacterized protein n=1 Tax=Phytophthora citrophthora TaxID=4793 RepID=A0AAD9GVI0_9STRA|nr:hypothetical protein P3T76_002763 [Phytophthora citrophthora]